VFAELYDLRRSYEGHGRFIEVTHTTDEIKDAGCYVDGRFVDEDADTLGWHLFKNKADGRIFRAPVIYGTNIVNEKISLEQLSPAKDSIQDNLDFSRSLTGAAWESFPVSINNRTFCRCEYRLPDGFADVEYMGFEKKGDFAGKAELAEFQIYDR